MKVLKIIFYWIISIAIISGLIIWNSGQSFKDIDLQQLAKKNQKEKLLTKKEACYNYFKRTTQATDYEIKIMVQSSKDCN